MARKQWGLSIFRGLSVFFWWDQGVGHRCGGCPDSPRAPLIWCHAVGFRTSRLVQPILVTCIGWLKCLNRSVGTFTCVLVIHVGDVLRSVKIVNLPCFSLSKLCASNEPTQYSYPFNWKRFHNFRASTIGPTQLAASYSTST